MVTHLRATEHHLPYDMGSHSVTCLRTQVNVPHLNPSQAGLYSIYLPQRNGQAELTLVVGFIPRWFTCPPTVAHPGCNHLIGS